MKSAIMINTFANIRKRSRQFLLLLFVLVGLITRVDAQDNGGLYQPGEEGQTGRTGFQKDKLFTGGSLSFGLSNNSFQIGGSPFLGYNLATWIDAGITFNYNYASYRDLYISGADDKIRK